MTMQRFLKHAALTLAVFGLLLALLMMQGCASVRPDPTKYLTPTDHGSYTFDKMAYSAALKESERKDFGCVVADATTTWGGCLLGLAEGNPLGCIITPLAGLVIHKTVVAPARDAGDDLPQKVENVAHCGAAALNVAVIASAL